MFHFRIADLNATLHITLAQALLQELIGEIAAVVFECDAFLLKALREYAPTRQCCFILVTGKGDRAMIEEGKKYGLNNFLAKPFTTATLKAAIEAVVGKLV